MRLAIGNLCITLFLGLVLVLGGVKNVFAYDQSQALAALQAASSKNYGSARSLAAQSGDPNVADIITWFELRDDSAKFSFTKADAFLRAHGDWPSVALISRNAEENMSGALPDSMIINWFQKYPPKTAEGMRRYLSAVSKTGRSAEVSGILHGWWPDAALSPSEQGEFLSRYGKSFNLSDHRLRLNRLLNRQELTVARALADRLGGDYRKLVEARIGLAYDKDNVQALVNAVPQSLTNDSGFVYDRLSWRRRHDEDQGVLELLEVKVQYSDPEMEDKWWRERHIMVRRMIERGRYLDAYNLASSHSQRDGLSFAQAEWVSGWLALRFVGKPLEAFRHFEAMYNNVSSPISRARGAYWAGRAAESLGQNEIARMWYEAALVFPTTYYGQKAGESLGQTDRIKQAALTKNNWGEQQSLFAAIYGDSRVQAAMLLQKAGMPEESADFLMAMANDVQEPRYYEPLADLATKMNMRHTAIYIANKAERDGVSLPDYSFPTILQYIDKNVTLDKSLVHAIIRQESRFKQDAVSHAGARGLMQLMPATAKETAGKLGVAHNTSWLISRPNYNILLGSTYLQRMLDRYDGSLPMAIAAYNGGPGRVDRWIKEFGDPRDGLVDMMDWIELIPIYETRNYVQRVLEAHAVYKMKLGGSGRFESLSPRLSMSNQ